MPVSMNFRTGGNSEPKRKLGFAAPKARNVIAQGNALGELWYMSLKALKARDNGRRLST